MLDEGLDGEDAASGQGGAGKAFAAASNARNIYNPINALITRDDVRDIFGRVGLTDEDITVFDVQHYQRAFVHKSYSLTSKDRQAPTPPDGVVPLQPHNNERDEYFGDSLLGCIVAKYLFRRLVEEGEGTLTRARTKLVNGRFLAHLAAQLGFDRHVIISAHVEQKCNGRALTSVLENALEAFVAAVYHDQHALFERRIDEMALATRPKRRTRYVKTCDAVLARVSASGIAFAQTETFVVAMIEKLVDFSALLANESNYKDILLKHFQKKFKGSPSYKEVATEGPPHKRTFTMSVHHINGVQLGVGTGGTKRDAQHAAAREALNELGIEARYA